MRCIATTTIFPPSKALQKFAQMKDWTLVIAGDLKTPHTEYLSMENVVYLHPDEQSRLYPRLSELIGWNCIQRRNIALLHAYKLGAEIIALVDDDNIPDEHWGENLLIGKPTKCKVYTPTKCPVFDPLSATEYSHLWHRGFPIQYLNVKNSLERSFDIVTPDIQADFWNGDPDVDAICRMEHAPDCAFNPAMFPFASPKPSPFNSQNTFLSRKVVPDYFCFPFVGRMDDIWGAYYCWAKGHRVVYSRASVTQERNAHDLTKDFKNEIIGYEHTHLIADDPSQLQKFVPERSWDAFLEYRRELGV
jgi:hypothetical protein